jgi:hypothetical protein
MEVAGQVREWLSRPVPSTTGTMEVLDELYSSYVTQPSLQSVVACGLRQMRESLSGSVETKETHSEEITASQVITEHERQDSGTQTKSSRRSRGRGGFLRRRQSSNIVPLMSVRCTRTQRGFLGLIPCSVEWAHEYCTDLLRGSR